jgi:flagellar protein FliT
VERGAWIIQRYEGIRDFSAQMLAVAREGRWDELIAVEQGRAELVNDLMQDSRLGPVPASASTRVAELIEATRKLDAETLDLVEAWKVELLELLGSMRTERKLSDTYGA